MILSPSTVVSRIIQELQYILDAFRPKNTRKAATDSSEQVENYELWIRGQNTPNIGDDHSCAFTSELCHFREIGDSKNLCTLLRTIISRKSRSQNAMPESLCYELEQSIKYLGDHLPSKNNQDLKGMFEFFHHLKRLQGNTALMLSGGASMGTHHVGVMKALNDQNLLPKFVCGSSSGAIMASIAYTKTESEQNDALKLETIEINMLGELDNVKNSISVFLRRLNRLLLKGFVFDPEVIKRAMRHNLGDMTFLEAYMKTRKVLNITVSSPTMYEMPTLLNYLTAPNVLIWSAVVTSCAVPAFFQPCTLYSKNSEGEIIPWTTSHEDEMWIDGSVENDIPQQRLAEMFNITNFIVSQVNPHIYPFVVLKNSENVIARIIKSVLYLISSECTFRLDQLISLGILPRVCHYLKSVLNQKYTGDVTVMHSLGFYDYWTMFSPAKYNEVLTVIMRGERATWPFINQISHHLRIEKLLDDILVRLEKEMESKGISSANSSLENLLSVKE